MSDLNQDHAISVDIEALRERFPQTQALYREVCALLFFRYGVTPTANRLYQLVRKGSMSAPAQALSAFWEELRSKSRTKIEHPDLPEALGLEAGNLVAALWTKAQAAAQESLMVHRQEADLAVSQAQAQAAASQQAREEQLRAVAQLQEALDRARQQIEAQREELAAAREARAALVERLEAAALEIRTQQSQLEAARRDFADELRKLHAAAALSEERSRAMEKRMLVELDRERANAARLQKALDTTRGETSRAAEQHRQELDALQSALSDSRQQNGLLEGKVQTLTASLERAERQIEALQSQPAPSVTPGPESASPSNWEKVSKRRAERRKRTKRAATLAHRFGLAQHLID